MVQLPFAAGTLCVLAVAYLHSEKSPTVSLWAMVMSQYAMFLMIRHRLVGFELSLKRGVTLAFLAVVLAACVLLGLALISVLFGRTFSLEMSLILVVCAVALCVLYAALVPRLEAFFDAIFHRDRNHCNADAIAERTTNGARCSGAPRFSAPFCSACPPSRSPGRS